jgi:hypothetical protein
MKKQSRVPSRPESLSEWATYIQKLAGPSLFSQVVAANTHGFARTLLAEGFTMMDVEQVMLLWVRQLRSTGMQIPDGGPFDLQVMALTDDQARLGHTSSPEEVALLESLYPQSGSDDFDTFELAAAFDA